ncbi:MAG: hypothetical protein IJZ83_10070, partial [Clostridia bacterium]|nr:hypothetical protein [Clostridia bacterium]
RFFEKKLGKKLPCWVVARLNIYNSKNSLVGLQPGKKAFVTKRSEVFPEKRQRIPRIPYKLYFKYQQAIVKALYINITQICENFK